MHVGKSLCRSQLIVSQVLYCTDVYFTGFSVALQSAYAHSKKTFKVLCFTCDGMRDGGDDKSLGLRLYPGFRVLHFQHQSFHLPLYIHKMKNINNTLICIAFTLKREQGRHFSWTLSVDNTYKIDKAGFSATADIMFLKLLCVDHLNEMLYK